MLIFKGVINISDLSIISTERGRLFCNMLDIMSLSCMTFESFHLLINLSIINNLSPECILEAYLVGRLCIFVSISCVRHMEDTMVIGGVPG